MVRPALICTIGLVAGAAAIVYEPKPANYVQAAVTFADGKPLRPKGPPIVLRTPEQLKRAAERRGKGATGVNRASTIAPADPARDASKPAPKPTPKPRKPAPTKSKPKKPAQSGSRMPKSPVPTRQAAGRPVLERDSDGLLKREATKSDDPSKLSKISPASGKETPKRRPLIRRPRREYTLVN